MFEADGAVANFCPRVLIKELKCSQCQDYKRLARLVLVESLESINAGQFTQFTREDGRVRVSQSFFLIQLSNPQISSFFILHFPTLFPNSHHILRSRCLVIQDQLPALKE